MAANALLARFDNAEILVADDQESVIAANLDHAFELLERISANDNAQRFAMGDYFWPEPDSWVAQFRPYKVVDGVLHIPVKGMLLNDYPWQDGSWATGYDYIRAALERGLADPEVKGIAFIINSGGGEVAGNFDLVDQIFAARGLKPMRAFADEFAYSAAYSIASAAHRIVVNRTGGVGSIGVVTSRVDYSKALEKAGIKVHLIHYGKNKVDSYSTEPLSAEAKARIQARVDELGEVFVTTVSRNRGMDAQAIRDTEASTFTASKATSNGLADEIGSFTDSVAAFAAEVSKPKKGTLMSMKTNTETATEIVVDKAALDAAREEGRAAGFSAGEKAAYERVNAILASDEGKKRPKAALSAALKMTSASVEDVTAFLGDLAEEKAEIVEGKPGGVQTNVTGKNFTAKMDGEPQADLGAAGGSEEGASLSRAQKLLAKTKGAAKAAA